MRNPFEYGGVVSGEAFCNRQKELADLRRAMENAEKLFVFSERRYGKTSLVHGALGKILSRPTSIFGRRIAKRPSSLLWPAPSPSR
ncbi:MAG: hypothetical protein E6L07_01970 [Verrucomicrobia bacterium]|nr:MAG: hypothetical protein E6L07_01970 [Verrucomicrobiota bacterium]